MKEDDVLLRLKMEKVDLSQKLQRLNAFLNSPSYLEIDPVQQKLLVVQLSAMQTYNACVYMRIKAMEGK